MEPLLPRWGVDGIRNEGVAAGMLLYRKAGEGGKEKECEREAKVEILMGEGRKQAGTNQPKSRKQGSRRLLGWSDF